MRYILYVLKLSIGSQSFPVQFNSFVRLFNTHPTNIQCPTYHIATVTKIFSKLFDSRLNPQKWTCFCGLLSFPPIWKVWLVKLPYRTLFTPSEDRYELPCWRESISWPLWQRLCINWQLWFLMKLCNLISLYYFQVSNSGTSKNERVRPFDRG